MSDTSKFDIPILRASSSPSRQSEIVGVWVRGKTPSILQSLSPNTEEGIIDSFLDFVSVLQEAGLTKDALDEMVRWRDIMYFCERYNNEKNPVKKLPCTKAELIGILRRFDDKIIKPRLETFIRKITEVMYPDAAKVVKNVAKKVEKGITPTPDKPLTSVTAHISKDDIRLRIATMRQILERDAYFLFPKRTSLEAFLDGNNPEIDTESLIFLLDLKDSPSEEDMTVWEGITSNDALRSLSDKWYIYSRDSRILSFTSGGWTYGIRMWWG